MHVANSAKCTYIFYRTRTLFFAITYTYSTRRLFWKGIIIIIIIIIVYYARNSTEYMNTKMQTRKKDSRKKIKQWK